MNRRLHRAFVFGLLAVMLGAACSDAPRPRVGVKNVAAELVFGIPPVDEPVAPPGVLPEAPGNISEEDIDDGFFAPGPAGPPPRAQCPQAGPSDFPDQEAPPTIGGKPKEGTYLWKQRGTHKLQNFPFPLRLNEFENRQVREVVPSPTDPQNFTFKTTQRKPGVGSNTTAISTFIVDTTNPSAALRGILLDKIEEDRRDGSAVSTFDPEPNIMYLPVPVQQGPANTFETVGVDPRPPNFSTIRLRGYVKERKDIDACGKMIQTWLVDAEFFFASGTAAPRRTNYDYAIATHFGGLIVYERQQAPCDASNNDGSCTPPPELEYETNIGQTDPTPLEGRSQ